MNEGMLSTLAFVDTAKVSPRPKDDKHVICVYCNDSYDEAQVKECLRALISDVGHVPSAYKTDAYTHLEIDSKVVEEWGMSRMKSSMYTPKTLIGQEEIDRLFAEKREAAQSEVRRPATKEEEAKIGLELASDSEDEEEEPPAKKAKH